MDVALEKLRNEYRRCKAAQPLNLSGKRTECVMGKRRDPGIPRTACALIVLSFPEQPKDLAAPFFCSLGRKRAK